MPLPYAYAANNPLHFSDRDGRLQRNKCREVWQWPEGRRPRLAPAECTCHLKVVEKSGDKACYALMKTEDDAYKPGENCEELDGLHANMSLCAQYCDRITQQFDSPTQPDPTAAGFTKKQCPWFEGKGKKFVRRDCEPVP